MYHSIMQATSFLFRTNNIKIFNSYASNKVWRKKCIHLLWPRNLAIWTISVDNDSNSMHYSNTFIHMDSCIFVHLHFLHEWLYILCRFDHNNQKVQYNIWISTLKSPVIIMVDVLIVEIRYDNWFNSTINSNTYLLVKIALSSLILFSIVRKVMVIVKVGSNVFDKRTLLWNYLVDETTLLYLYQLLDTVVVVLPDWWFSI